MRGVGVACTVGRHGMGEGDLSEDDGSGGGGCIRDSWEMNTSTTQEKVSARRDNRRGRRSCFVAMREVEETSLGMRMTKKQEDNTASDLYSPGGEIRCMGRPSGNCTGHRPLALGFVKRASLATDLGR